MAYLRQFPGTHSTCDRRCHHPGIIAAHHVIMHASLRSTAYRNVFMHTSLCKLHECAFMHAYLDTTACANIFVYTFLEPPAMQRRMILAAVSIRSVGADQPCDVASLLRGAVQSRHVRTRHRTMGERVHCSDSLKESIALHKEIAFLNLLSEHSPASLRPVPGYTCPVISMPHKKRDSQKLGRLKLFLHTPASRPTLFKASGTALAAAHKKTPAEVKSCDRHSGSPSFLPLRRTPS